MSEDAVGEVWLKYKNTDEVLTTVQDDDFTGAYRMSPSRAEPGREAAIPKQVEQKLASPLQGMVFPPFE